MRTLHRTLMGMTLVALLALAAGVLQPWSPTAEAQHGQDDTRAHVDGIMEWLELNDAQRATLTEPLNKAAVAMQEVTRLHTEIAAELTDAQKEKFGQLLRDMLGAPSADRHSMGHQGGAGH